MNEICYVCPLFFVAMLACIVLTGVAGISSLFLIAECGRPILAGLLFLVALAGLYGVQVTLQAETIHYKSHTQGTPR